MSTGKPIRRSIAPPSRGSTPVTSWGGGRFQAPKQPERAKRSRAALHAPANHHPIARCGQPPGRHTARWRHRLHQRCGGPEKSEVRGSRSGRCRSAPTPPPARQKPRHRERQRHHQQPDHRQPTLPITPERSSGTPNLQSPPPRRHHQGHCRAASPHDQPRCRHGRLGIARREGRSCATALSR
jgi:hypothetical protein